MRSRLFTALPILLALSGCSEEIQAQDPPTALPGEIGANESPNLESEVDAPDVERPNPSDLD